MPTGQATDLIEAVCKQIVADHPDLPIVVEVGYHPDYTYYRTPEASTQILNQRCVRLIPGWDAVVVSGAGRYFFGSNERIGQRITVPTGMPADAPDSAVILGEAFRDAVVAAVRAKLVEVEAHYATLEAAA